MTSTLITGASSCKRGNYRGQEAGKNSLSGRKNTPPPKLALFCMNWFAVSVTWLASMLVSSETKVKCRPPPVDGLALLTNLRTHTTHSVSIESHFPVSYDDLQPVMARRWEVGPWSRKYMPPPNSAAVFSRNIQSDTFTSAPTLEFTIRATPPPRPVRVWLPNSCPLVSKR